MFTSTVLLLLLYVTDIRCCIVMFTILVVGAVDYLETSLIKLPSTKLRLVQLLLIRIHHRNNIRVRTDVL